jgi:DNA-directed RNA polymerase specialized sigma24 family protein
MQRSAQYVGIPTPPCVDRTALITRLAAELRDRANRSARDADQRSEIYQEMMVRAWASLPREATPADAAIALEAADAALKEHRLSVRRERAVPHADVPEESLPGTDDPESAFILRETMQAVFERFEATDRELVMMSLSGLSTSEIQRLTGLPKGTVVARIERTLRACGKHLGRKGVSAIEG